MRMRDHPYFFPIGRKWYIVNWVELFLSDSIIQYEVMFSPKYDQIFLDQAEYNCPKVNSIFLNDFKESLIISSDISKLNQLLKCICLSIVDNMWDSYFKRTKLSFDKLQTTRVSTRKLYSLRNYYLFSWWIERDNIESHGPIANCQDVIWIQVIEVSDSMLTGDLLLN